MCVCVCVTHADVLETQGGKKGVHAEAGCVRRCETEAGKGGFPSHKGGGRQGTACGPGATLTEPVHPPKHRHGRIAPPRDPSGCQSRHAAPPPATSSSSPPSLRCSRRSCPHPHPPWPSPCSHPSRGPPARACGRQPCHPCRPCRPSSAPCPCARAARRR
eukprot:scaffold732_cov85-Isochrysis_galbana.AAC.1